jgi:hypothetical protein
MPPQVKRFDILSSSTTKTDGRGYAKFLKD